ncbi:hypothetical protein [Pararoseomonas baculiformis]|nr:hypothetical protein [Pararoseomonas baculiformis]
MFQSLLRAGLLEEVSGAHDPVLRIAEAGVLAAGTSGVAEMGG